jgi:oxygen-independent coproporphyrinogen III oxidase
MAGIYIHIPFCKKACNYCNFHFSTSPKLQSAFLHALHAEINLQKDYLQEQVSTIYFGGGTPSILPANEIERILNELRENFDISTDAEITLEANPDDIDAAKLDQWKHAGINRLSIGIQSFVEDDLKWMNRAHNATQAINSIHLAQQYGFNNLTVDLIYGTPTLSDEQWKKNVQQVIDLDIPHISCYALTVESKTALEKLIEKKKLSPVDSNKQAHHFELLMKWLNEDGYEHYEISNFAKPGFRSRHNSSYWQGSHYLGLGPSAHSFNGVSRQWNIANNALYIKSLEQYTVPYEQEILTKTQQVNEYLMTGLRTMEGVSFIHLRERFGNDIVDEVTTAASPHIAHHHLIIEEDSLRTTNAGKLLADGIAADLFIDERG